MESSSNPSLQEQFNIVQYYEYSYFQVPTHQQRLECSAQTSVKVFTDDTLGSFQRMVSQVTYILEGGTINKVLMNEFKALKIYK